MLDLKVTQAHNIWTVEFTADKLFTTWRHIWCHILIQRWRLLFWNWCIDSLVKASRGQSNEDTKLWAETRNKLRETKSLLHFGHLVKFKVYNTIQRTNDTLYVFGFCNNFINFSFTTSMSIWLHNCILDIIYMHTKFGDSRFSRSRDMIAGIEYLAYL